MGVRRRRGDSYIPANVLPVLTTTALGSSHSETIMGGVVFLYATGSWALIVLVASVMIPLGSWWRSPIC
jgi:paraquat-inducible protein A